MGLDTLLGPEETDIRVGPLRRARCLLEPHAGPIICHIGLGCLSWVLVAGLVWSLFVV